MNTSGSTLIATSRSSFASRARYTSPIAAGAEQREDLVRAETHSSRQRHESRPILATGLLRAKEKPAQLVMRADRRVPRPFLILIVPGAIKWGVKRRPARVVVAALVACTGLLACNRGPASPGDAALASGRWTGDGACLSVTDAGCNLAVGCGHGQFARPIIRGDGTFDAYGTYRIEVGPIAIEPAPPAHFSGSITGSRLKLTVVPTAGSLLPASYSMTLTVAGGCPIPCV